MFLGEDPLAEIYFSLHLEEPSGKIYSKSGDTTHSSAI